MRWTTSCPVQKRRRNDERHGLNIELNVISLQSEKSLYAREEGRTHSQTDAQEEDQ